MQAGAGVSHVDCIEVPLGWIQFCAPVCAWIILTMRRIVLAISGTCCGLLRNELIHSFPPVMREIDGAINSICRVVSPDFSDGNPVLFGHERSSL
jgi:hypothetical protein